MKLRLHAGVCAARWRCKNLDKDICFPIPKNKKPFVECEFFIPDTEKVRRTNDT